MIMSHIIIIFNLKNNKIEINMKIALIQQTASSNIQQNLEKGLKNVLLAAKNDAKIICFSELAFTPFYPQKHAENNYKKLAEPIPNKDIEKFQLIAKEYGVVIILNLYELSGENTFDSSPVINSDGKILGTTRMIHITDYEYFYEQEYYTPGDTGANVYETEFGNIGISICYDRHYPEYMRALAVKGADIVFIPQAGSLGEWPEGLYEAEMRVHSFHNGYFTALCNRVGKEENLTFSGESFVCNPSGKVINRAGKLTEEILYADLDLSEVKNSHSRRLFMKHRRPELYLNWIK